MSYISGLPPGRISFFEIDSDDDPDLSKLDAEWEALCNETSTDENIEVLEQGQASSQRSGALLEPPSQEMPVQEELESGKGQLDPSIMLVDKFHASRLQLQEKQPDKASRDAKLKNTYPIMSMQNGGEDKPPDGEILDRILNNLAVIRREQEQIRADQKQMMAGQAYASSSGGEVEHSTQNMSAKFLHGRD